MTTYSSPGPPPAWARPVGGHRGQRDGRWLPGDVGAGAGAGGRPGRPCSTNLCEGDVLFVDEIHRLARPVEEILYPAMEDFQLDIVLGKGPRPQPAPGPAPFHPGGRYQRTGLITGPLRDRFGLVARLDYYDVPELEIIVRRSAGVLGAQLDEAGGARSPAGPGARPGWPTGCSSGS